MQSAGSLFRQHPETGCWQIYFNGRLPLCADHYIPLPDPKHRHSPAGLHIQAFYLYAHSCREERDKPHIFPGENGIQ